MSTEAYTTAIRSEQFMPYNWNPIRSLNPQSLVRILDDFHAGRPKEAALLWEAIEHRDDLLSGVIPKRKKATSRRSWEISTLDNSEKAMHHKVLLEKFYNNLTCTNAYDENEYGGLSLLIRQMMDAVGKRYAVHEIVFKPLHQKEGDFLTAEFRFVPLFFFENQSGKLHFIDPHTHNAVPTTAGKWLVTTGDGLMEPCSIAYLFKHLPLRDWLTYCERNGMPIVKGVTQARPGSAEWEQARQAVQHFGPECHVLMSGGTDIEAIDISGKGELPYPKLVERMDRAMAALWRGSDLATLSQENATGATTQRNESNLLEEDDAQMISETLNEQVDRWVLYELEHIEQPMAYFRLRPPANKNLNNDLAIIKTLYDMGVSLSLNDIREHFGINPPTDTEDTVSNQR